MVLDFEPSFGAATYVGNLLMVSIVPVGVPSCTLPERQHALDNRFSKGVKLSRLFTYLIPTPVDISSEYTQPFKNHRGVLVSLQTIEDYLLSKVKE